MSFRSRPQRVLKKGIDSNEERNKRAETSIELRKNKREESIQKRRQFGTSSFISDSFTINNSSLDPAEVAEKLKQIPQLVAGINSNDSNGEIMKRFLIRVTVQSH